MTVDIFSIENGMVIFVREHDGCVQVRLAATVLASLQCILIDEVHAWEELGSSHIIVTCREK